MQSSRSSNTATEQSPFETQYEEFSATPLASIQYSSYVTTAEATTIPQGMTRKVNSKVTDSGNLSVLTESLTEIARIQSAVLGKGAYGSVYIARGFMAGEPTTIAAKTIIYPRGNDYTRHYNNLDPFYDYVKSHGLESILLIPYRTGLERKPESESANATAYQFMRLAKFGDGNKLIKVLAELNDLESKDLLKRHVLRSLMKAYTKMDEVKIRHLDLKPGNILFDEEGRCYVSDFDLSVIFNTKDRTLFWAPKKVGWDPIYAPYNQQRYDLMSETELDEQLSALDAYRLGLTCLLMYCEISEEEAIALLKEGVQESFRVRKIEHEELVERLRNVPTPVTKVIMGLLNYDLAKRMTVVQANEDTRYLELNDEENEIIKSMFSRWCDQSQNAKALSKTPEDRSGYDMRTPHASPTKQPGLFSGASTPDSTPQKALQASYYSSSEACVFRDLTPVGTPERRGGRAELVFFNPSSPKRGRENTTRARVSDASQQPPAPKRRRFAPDHEQGVTRADNSARETSASTGGKRVINRRICSDLFPEIPNDISVSTQNTDALRKTS